MVASIPRQGLALALILSLFLGCSGSDSTSTSIIAPPTASTTTQTLTMADGSQLLVVADLMTVTFKEDVIPADRQAVLNWLANRNVTILKNDVQAQILTIRVSPTSLAQLLADASALPGVFSATPEPVMAGNASASPDRFTNCPTAANGSYLPSCDMWLNIISARQAWDTTIGTLASSIGIIDEGMTNNIEGKPVTKVPNGILDVPFSSTPNDHGTLVAAIAGAKGNDGIGIAGLAWESPLSWGPMILSPGLPLMDLLDFNPVPAVINISRNAPLGSSKKDARYALYPSIRKARQKQVLVVFSAGNDYDKNDHLLIPSSPEGALQEQILKHDQIVADWQQTTLIVGALGSSTGSGLNFRKPAEFATEGMVVDIYAPGVQIGTLAMQGCVPPFDRFVNCGSSFAAPQAAGVAALVKALNPTFTPNQIKGRILDSACQVGGTKILNASRAVNPQRDAAGNVSYIRANIAYTDHGSGAVVIQDLGGNTVRTTQHGSAFDSLPSFSPDGRQVAFSRITVSQDGSSSSEIIRVNVDDGAETPVHLNAVNPAWSPDGTRIAYVDLICNCIVLWHLESGTPIYGTHPGNAQDSTPAWSPDGRKIAFTRTTPGTTISDPSESKIMVLDVESQSESQLPRHPLINAMDPDWSPDGTQLAFTALPQHDPNDGSQLGNGVVYIWNVYERGAAYSTDGGQYPGQDAGPKWLPDGKGLAFVRWQFSADPQVPPVRSIRLLTLDPARVVNGHYPEQEIVQNAGSFSWSSCFSPRL